MDTALYKNYLYLYILLVFSPRAMPQDLKLQVENAQRFNQSQTERCKQLEEKNNNLEKASGLLGDEKQNVDLNMHELVSELATVREKASAMEVMQRQKVDALEAEMATMKQEFGESVTQVCVYVVSY